MNPQKPPAPQRPGSAATAPAPALAPAPAKPSGSKVSGGAKKSAALNWSGAIVAAALIVVPLWMLLDNSAVLAGHPALPALLLATVALGTLWALILLKRWNRLRAVSRWLLLRGFTGRLLALGLVAAMAWLSPFPYQPPGTGGQSSGTTTEDATSIALAPEGKAGAGLVFYPGARVDAHAYRDVLGPLANAGYLVVILKEPLGLSLLDPSQARGVMDRHPEITSWAVGGHSLGGVSASSFAKANDDVAGLLLFASYPADNMAAADGVSVLSVSGSHDGFSTPDKIASSKTRLPASTEYVVVEGGVHAFFGDYGEQPGDGEPGISRELAQQQIAAASLRFMDRLRTPG